MFEYLLIKVQLRRTQIQTKSPQKFHICSCFVIVFSLNVRKFWRLGMSLGTPKICKIIL